MFVFLDKFLKFIILFLCGIIVLLPADIEVNPGPNRPNYCNFCNARGCHGNLNDLAVISTKFDTICCAETLVQT